MAASRQILAARVEQPALATAPFLSALANSAASSCAHSSGVEEKLTYSLQQAWDKEAYRQNPKRGRTKLSTSKLVKLWPRHPTRPPLVHFGSFRPSPKWRWCRVIVLGVPLSEAAIWLLISGYSLPISGLQLDHGGHPQEVGDRGRRCLRKDLSSHCL